ncbi:MAG: hypothetical protein AB1552_00925 [Nitrospirota bacterium]
MKCPYCGEELKGKDVCAGCGKKVPRPDAELEVEYKDFKISEFLEIRKKQQTSGNGEPKASERRSLRSPGKSSGTGQKKTARPRTRKPGKRSQKKEYTLMRILLIVLAAIVMAGGAYFFLRTLFGQ